MDHSPSRRHRSRVKLDATKAALIKGMLRRGDRQSDIVAYFGGVFNPGRISEINTGQRFPDVDPAPVDVLPPPGPYEVH